MLDPENAVITLYRDSRKLLRESKAFYRQNYRAMTRRQRRSFRAKCRRLNELLNPARVDDSLPHRVVAGALDAFYRLTFRAVVKVFPYRE
jgi:hypothetical protein